LPVRKPTSAIALGAILVLALGLRVAFLDRSELWFDEAYAALIAAESAGEILAEIRNDSSPPFYFLLLHGWIALVGGSPIALRSLSVLCGVVSVFLMYLLARELQVPAAAHWGALLLAVSPLHLYYSQEARAYALFVLLALAALLALERLRRLPGSGSAGLFILATTLAIYTHNYGLFLLPIFFLYAAMGWIPARWAVGCLAPIALAYAPWVPFLSHQVRTGAAGWVERIWMATPPRYAIPKTFAAFTVGGQSPPYVDIGSASLPGWVSVAAYLFFGVLAAEGLRQSRAARLVAMGLLVLLGVPFALSFFLPVYVVGRYDVLALPLFLLGIAVGLSSLFFRARLVSLTLLGALSTTSLIGYYGRNPLRGVVPQAEVVTRFAGPGDAVLCTGFTRNPLEYYVRRRGSAIPFHSYPMSTARHRGWVDETELQDAGRLSEGARVLVEELRRSLEPTDRLWLVHSRLLAESGQVLIVSLESAFERERCPADGENFGMTCWRRLPRG
jgi:hypothetical protein